MTARGALLGNRYELDQVVGRGGMAEVWKAKDIRLGREVAVKRLRVDLASDSTFQARFRREAQAAAGLNHPNIVSVYDTGEEIDPASGVHVPYIVMELVEGVTLRDILRDGRKILPERALEFTQGVLDALAYSHRAGIVHRDIKPANVMLTGNGQVKVMDFGIARAVADTSATMTQTAAVIGTAQYLSPEQARGEKVDFRSDIYSTGCLLYELLVGRPPFVGDSPVSVAYQHVREMPTAPGHFDSEITAEMDAIVLKALAKDPVERYPNAKAMSDDLARCLANVPVEAAITSPTAAATTMSAAPTQVITPAEATTVSSPARRMAAEPAKKKGPSVPTIVLSSLVAALAITITVAVYILTRQVTPAVVEVDVPSVVGFNQVAAERTLTDAKLVPNVKRAHNAKPKGEVIDQDPKPGNKVPEKSSVTITVSDGPLKKAIPSTILGMTYEQAQKALRDAEFTGVIKSKEADPASEPITAVAGTVIGSDPKPGTESDPQAQITLEIATGKSIVPNFRGKTMQEAQDLARRVGFSLSFVEIETTYPEGKVFEQSAPDGQPESRSTTIELKVAKAPPTPPTTQPSTTVSPSPTPTPDG